MHYLRQAALIGQVCVTAIMTLIAGLPHFDCVCPSGQHKPLCLGITAPRGGCCCGGACCSSSSGQKCCGGASQETPPAAQSQARCCRQRQPRARGDRPTPGLDATGCRKKTVTGESIIAVAPTQSSAKQTPADSFSVPVAQLAIIASAPMTGNSPLSWHEYELPPPTDLVIVLLHFLI